MGMWAEGCLPDGRIYGRSAHRKSNKWIKCPICEKWGRAHRDHDHESGRIREVICSACNLGLGHFGDDPDTLMRAAEYLKKHKRLDFELKLANNG